MDEIIHKLFPHRDEAGGPSYRRHQFEIIRDVIQALDGGEDDVIVEAPTGAGKTDIAKTVALYFTRDFHRQFGGDNRNESMLEVMAPHQAHMITSMKMLQDAYLQSAGHVSLVKGRSNYSCPRTPHASVDSMAESIALGGRERFTCNDAKLIYGKLCSRDCPYLEAREDAQFSAIALHNFDSFIAQASLGGVFIPRQLLTVDEGHNTEEKLINSMTMNFMPKDFERAGLFWTKPIDESMDAAMEWADVQSKQVKRHLKKAQEEMASIQGRRLTMQSAKRSRQLAHELSYLEEMDGKINRFINSRTGPKKPVDWVMEIEGDSVRLEPVTGTVFIRDALLKFGSKRLFLSATFLDGRGIFRRSCRIKKAKYLAIPSTFPSKRRPVIKAYAGNLGYRTFEANLGNVKSKISEIMDENPGVRGIIHCTSYKLSQQIRSMGLGNRMVFHDKGSRERVVNGFMDSSAPDAVLVGVALSEGYDFKADLARFQILIKIPYPFPTKRILARKEKQPLYMDWRTCLTLVQSYGRGVRSKSDWCRTYVLDSRFDKFVNVNRNQLPKWFLEAIQ